MPTSNTVYCGYPAAFISSGPAPKEKKERLKHLFWGDTIALLGDRQGDYVEVQSRDVEGWMKEAELMKDPLLDIVFIDVGQGDSCLIVTPADEKIVVDAGKEDNLLRYLRWRYKNYESPEMRAMGGLLKAVVISHPDDDHYLGLKPLIEDPKFGPLIKIEALYHNGLFVRQGEGLASLGTLEKKGKITYLTDPIITPTDLKNFFASAPGWEKREYPSLVREIQQKNSGATFAMLNQTSAGIPNLTPVPGLSIKILGPILEKEDGGRRLRTFGGDVGQTKNGHSIILLVQYGNIRILLGGDLNIPSEEFLLAHYAAQSLPDAFQAEVLKAYHHGSGDFSEEFIESIKPYVSVISSGDNESFSHPRADTMGFLGKASRGRRPLLFSTELARSAVEAVKDPIVLKQEMKALQEKLVRTDVPPADRQAAADRLDELENKLINRSIAVYGAINLRTDGKKLLMCQKKEAPNAEREEWDIYRIEPDPNTQELNLVPKN
jgi:beta-lactamase superfamily II metal-dependent hydrolase